MKPRSHLNEYTCRLDLLPRSRPDGDTVRLHIVIFDDRGSEYSVTRNVRLVAAGGKGIDTPERKNETLEAGDESRDYTLGLFKEYEPRGLVCYLWGLDKYGRPKAQIMGEDEEGQPIDFGERLVASGHAVYREYE